MGRRRRWTESLNLNYSLSVIFICMLVFGLLAPAFISGIIIFLAPCTLPMVPGYLAFISGVDRKDLSDPKTKSFAESKIRKNSIFFVLGFSLVFIVIGIFFGIFGSFLAPFRLVLLRVGGGLIILFSLFMLKVFPDTLFGRNVSLKIPSWLHLGNPKSSFIVGSIFALGWSPCIGPILGTILVLAGSVGTAFQGGILLAMFSLGFSIPFLLSAFLYHSSQNFFVKHEYFFKMFSILGGILMLTIGILLVLNEWSLFQEWGFKIFKFIEYDKLQNYL